MVDMNKVLKLHEKHTGVLGIDSAFDVTNRTELGEAYTPGVADLAKLIEKDETQKNKYTMSGKLVAIITDGSAVLGLGNVGPSAGLPIIEGKALLYKDFADVDAVPLALDQVPVDEFVKSIKNMAKSFAGIHLEDIAAPRVFEIEEKLANELDIPVYHDDQTGTAIVVLAGLINAAKYVDKPLKNLKVVINGVGASGVATAKILLAAGIKHITLVDINGVIREDDMRYNNYQRDLAKQVIQANGQTLNEVITDQDVFVGLSDANVLDADQVKRMATNPIVFALANPVPEIDPEDAKKAGAAIVATGSSQWPNQVNNILAFPGLFKGLLASGLKKVDMPLQVKVAEGLAGLITKPGEQSIVPGVFDEGVVQAVSQAVMEYANN
ncbi:NAD(P)-dependent malic enzyme [Weissella sagaensis]|uniref:NADP-dependent malic enzyme n=1 Tax=Weissella sagaensis TaxID=2559928 RepID=A0ABW1RRT5_9LACO|nr:NADP-dependent malic enzyme [Weissella sagaensis]KAA8432297.1 NADP-dependent malic enzyme [Weissella paramesenteroides]MBU7568475.1 NADP-dependent malic enzyme [Weissella hellenica]KAA8439435.1 NADP-dependent malic enzyme [Weissella paramesenteroides]QDJ58521.1 NADP-dependent malic enzyme [Weissella hellenica]QEA57461.1 NADP-dependent malic enzyme [Weissella hellenica]